MTHKLASLTFGGVLGKRLKPVTSFLSHTQKAVTWRTDVRVGTSGSYAPLRHSACTKPRRTANSQRLGQFSRCVSESAFIKAS